MHAVDIWEISAFSRSVNELMEGCQARACNLKAFLLNPLTHPPPRVPCFVSITHGFDGMIISESINKYRHTFTYGEFQLLPQGDSARPWASTPVRGVPWVGCGTFWSVLLRLAAGVTCCALGFEHLAPEIFPSQIAPLHLFITTEK